MSSSPKAAKLPTPTAPIKSAEVVLGGTGTSNIKKLEGLKQLQIQVDKKPVKKTNNNTNYNPTNVKVADQNKFSNADISNINLRDVLNK